MFGQTGTNRSIFTIAGYVISLEVRVPLFEDCDGAALMGKQQQGMECLPMRRMMFGLLALSGLLFAVGCNASRAERVQVQPDWSITQAEPQTALDSFWPVPTDQTDRVAKLPPTPAAPGFERLIVK